MTITTYTYALEAPAYLNERDEPLLTIVARRADGTVIDLTGSTVKWVSKANRELDDTSGTTIIGTVTDASAGKFTVQITAPVTAVAGTYFYKLVLTKASKPFTFRFGDLHIIST